MCHLFQPKKKKNQKNNKTIAIYGLVILILLYLDLLVHFISILQPQINYPLFSILHCIIHIFYDDTLKTRHYTLYFITFTYFGDDYCKSYKKPHKYPTKKHNNIFNHMVINILTIYLVVIIFLKNIKILLLIIEFSSFFYSCKIWSNVKETKRKSRRRSTVSQSPNAGSK